MENFALEKDIDKQVFIFENKEYSKEETIAYAKKYLANQEEDLHNSLFEFLLTWFNGEDCLEVKTSGSTGEAKLMQVEKKSMIESACLTCTFFNLKKYDKTLLCMPLEFIAAKMLVVRALVAGLDLYNVVPSSNPYLEIANTASIPDSYDFIPMTPQQAWNSLLAEESKNLFVKTKHVLLGGMAVCEELKDMIMDYPNNVWSSYGMTETLSHIAVRKVNGEDATNYFTAFKDIEISKSDEDTLIIFAPRLNPEKLYSKDRVEFLEDKSFRVLGRVDNCINSGGIKIQIEEVEEKLSKILPNDVKFQVTSAPCNELGDKLVLLMDKEIEDFSFYAQQLPRYWKPKHRILVEVIPQTGTGKPDRYTAKEIAKAHLTR